MYAVRPKTSASIKTNQPGGVCEIAATHDNLPKELNENWMERWCTVPTDFEENFEKIFNFELRSDDVFVVSQRRAGTTWSQEAVWLLLNNLDFERAKSVGAHDRCIFLNFSGLLSLTKGNHSEKSMNAVDVWNAHPSPRSIKAHMAANLLPKQIWEKKSKIIYVARNVKDVVISSYHYNKNLGTWRGRSIDEYVDDFISNEILYTSFWPHVVDFWKLRNEPNVCFITYEEMKRSLADVLQKLCKFLDRPELNAEELTQCLDHLSFNQMKNNKRSNWSFLIKQNILSANKDFEFFRRGIVGSYKSELSKETRNKLNEWTKECLAKYGITEEDIFGDLN